MENRLDLQGRVALVTGGAHRVGRALALALARAGCDVAIHQHRSADDTARTVHGLEALGVRAVALTAELAEATAAAPLIEDAVAALGRLYVLVNSSSLFERPSVFDIDAA